MPGIIAREIRPGTAAPHISRRRLPVALGLALLAADAQAAGTLTELGALNGGNTSYANAINAAGDVIAGYALNGATGRYEAFRWTLASGMVGLGQLNGGNGSRAYAINAAGDVIAGEAVNNDSTSSEAFRWTQAGGMVGLGQLNGGNISAAFAINATGDVIAGEARNGATGNREAFRWTQAGGMVGLGQLNGGNNSVAYAINGVGDVIAGSANNGATGNNEAFRWTQASGMVGLGQLNGGDASNASAINAAGDVIAGAAYNGATGSTEAFRWTQAGGMVGLGQLNGGNYSYANAINAAGDVIVGVAADGATGNNILAMRWTQASGMISVEQWLANAGVSIGDFSELSVANGVNAAGDVVTGYGLIGGNSQAYLARVSPTATGIVGSTDLGNSLGQSLALSSQNEMLTSLIMNGNHNRTLMDLGLTDSKGTCAWVSGDAGAAWRRANGALGNAEAGLCHDLLDNRLRVGAGLGTAYSDLDLANHGNSRLKGQYGFAEADWKVRDDVVASLAGIYGRWDADLKRGYAITGTQPSNGSTDMDTYSLRARLDWMDAFHLGQVSFSPRIAYSITHSDIDSYREKGGSAPATFDSQAHTAKEVRLGLTARYDLSEKATLRGHAELAHRFDDRTESASGNLSVLGLDFGRFNIDGNRVARDWARVGAEIDYRVSPSSILNANAFVASQGQDADATVGVSYRHMF